MVAGNPRATYRVQFRNSKGVSKLRYARTYSVWFGRTKIVDNKPFPPSKRKVADREKYVAQVIARHKRKREKELEEQRKARELEKKREQRRKKAQERKKKKEAEYKKATEAHEKSSIIAKSRIPKAEVPVLEFAYDQIEQETSDFESLRVEAPQTLPNATIKDVFVIPVTPDNDVYEKEVVEKWITTDNGRRTLLLTILNFTLKDDYWVVMDQSVFKDAFNRAFSLMFPHLSNFYADTAGSTDSYILRIKYAYEPRGSAQFYDQGISLNRFDNTLSPNLMRDLFIKTMRKFIGYDSNGVKNLKNSYLVGDTMIYIIGFTLESSVEREL